MARTGVASVALVVAALSAAAGADNRRTTAATTTSDLGATQVSMRDVRGNAAAPAPDASYRRSDAVDVVALSERWRDVPQSKRLKLSIQITDELTELGNLIGTSMNELSDDMLGLQFDGRKRRAKLRVGTGHGQFLRFRFESDWHFTRGKARIVAKVQLGLGDHHWNIELPDMEMAPTSVRGERGVEVRVPLFERSW